MFGTKFGSNIAYFYSLGFLPKRVTRALGLAQDTGPGAFYFAFPPSRIRPRVQDLTNMRPERHEGLGGDLQTGPGAKRLANGRRCVPYRRRKAHAGRLLFHCIKP